MNNQCTYYFTLHDSGGRVVECLRISADRYSEAYEAAEGRAREIHSHGITCCDSYWRAKQPSENLFI